MKRKRAPVCGLLLVCFCGALGAAESSASHPTNDITLAEALPLAKVRLQELDSAGGFGGWGITPTDFLELSVVFVAGGDRKLFDSFLASVNPIVAAMGLVCLSQTDSNAFHAAACGMRTSARELTVWTGGCVPSSMTLGELATEMQQNRNFLGHEDNYWDFQKYRDKVNKGSVPRDVVTPKHRVDYSMLPKRPGDGTRYVVWMLIAILLLILMACFWVMKKRGCSLGGKYVLDS